MYQSKIDQKMVYPKKTVSRSTGKFVIFNRGTSTGTFKIDGEFQEIKAGSKLIVGKGDNVRPHSSHPHIEIVEEIEIISETKVVEEKPKKK